MSKESFEHILNKERAKNPYTDELIEKFVPNFRELIKNFDK